MINFNAPSNPCDFRWGQQILDLQGSPMASVSYDGRLLDMQGCTIGRTDGDSLTRIDGSQIGSLDCRGMIISSSGYTIGRIELKTQVDINFKNDSERFWESVDVCLGHTKFETRAPRSEPLDLHPPYPKRRNYNDDYDMWPSRDLMTPRLTRTHDHFESDRDDCGFPDEPRRARW